MILFVDGKVCVQKVSKANRLAYASNEGTFELFVQGRSEYVGSYPECRQYVDECVHAHDLDSVDIVPWFDQTEWAA